MPSQQGNLATLFNPFASQPNWRHAPGGSAFGVLRSGAGVDPVGLKGTTT